jgi:hypothetical protein
MREVTLHAGHLGNTWSMGQALQSERVDSPCGRGRDHGPRDRGPREDRLTGGVGPAAQAGGPPVSLASASRPPNG